MKTGLRYARLSAAIIAALYSASAAHADNLLWDPSGTAAPAGSEGTGNWDTSTVNWSDQTTSKNVAWSNITPPNSAIFGTGPAVPATVGAANFAILTTNISVQNITLNTGSDGSFYNITDDGNGENLTVAGNIIKASGIGNSVFQLSGALNLTAGNHTVALNDTPGDTPELSINNAIGGAGSLTLDNSFNSSGYAQYGTLVLNGNDSYSGGTTVAFGRLVANTATALGTGAITVSNAGDLSFGGAGSKTSGSITITNPVNIARNTYTGTNFGDYGDAINSDNPGNAGNTLTFSGPFTVDSTDARVATNTSTVVISSNLAAGADVAAGAAVLDLDGDFAGIVKLTGNNTAYGAAGNAIELINGVELNPANDAALGGPGSKLILTGGELHITSALLASNPAFATNFGGHTIVNNTVGTGVDVDKGLTFTVNVLSGDGVGMRGGGTLNFTGTNTFTGTPYYDGVDDGPGEGTESDTSATGVVNFEAGSNTTQGGLRIRSATVNVAGALNVGGAYTSIGADSTGSNGSPDYGTVNITGNGALTETTGDDFNVSDNANTHGTINLSGSGALTVNGTLYDGKSAGAIGTITMGGSSTFNSSSLVFIGENDGTGVFTQNGGTLNLTRNANFTFVINDGRGGSGAGSGTYNLNGGTFTSAGEVYVGEGGNGNNATWNQTGGTAVLENWLVFGREGGSGTMNLSGGSLTRTDNSGNIGDENGSQTSIGEGGKTSTLNVTGTGQFAVNTGELWVGNNGGSGVLNIGTKGLTTETSSVISNNWLAVGRGGSSTGVVNLYDGTLTQALNNYFDISGDGGSPTGTVNVYGGTLNAYQMLIGENGSGAGTLNISGGTVNLPNNTVLANSDSVTGTLNLSGGTLNAFGFTANSGVLNENAGTGAAKFVFNGGTLVATADNTTFIGANVNSVVSSGGAIINNNGHAVTVASSLTHDSSVSGKDGGLTVSGLGTTTLSGTNTYTGLTTVTNGTLVMDSAAQAPVLNGGGANIKLGSLVLDYNGGADPVATVRSDLAASYAASGGPFTSGQIYSSKAVTGKLGLGYGDNTTTGQVTVKYTLYGDTNLDGKVNLGDFGVLKQNYGATTGGTWSKGDFNYDGKVNLGDFGLLKSNFGSPLPTSNIAEVSPALQFHSDLAAGQVQLEVNVTTGDAQLDFDNATIGGYEIDSALGELVAANWKTLASQGYSGFSTLGTPTANLLSEGNLNSFLTYNGDIDIGDIFATSTPSAAQDLVFSYLDSNFGQDFVPVVYTGGTSTPEPTSLTLLALGSVGLMARRRRSVKH